MIRASRRCILLILLSCLSIAAFADDGTTTSMLGCGGAPFACTMLGKIFGNVAPLHADGGVLNQIMQVINIGLSSIVGIYCGYASLSSVHEMLKGGLQSVQMQLAMPFLRLALAMSLLVPLPGTGYSSYQTIVMNVAVAGADLANKVWSTAVQSIGAGLRITPSTSSDSGSSASGLYNVDGNPYQSSSSDGGLQTIKNYQYVEALFEHAVCYEEQQAARNAGPDSISNSGGNSFVASSDAPTALGSPFIGDDHKLHIPTDTDGRNM